VMEALEGRRVVWHYGPVADVGAIEQLDAT